MNKLLTATALCSLGLSSCAFQTHSKIHRLGYYRQGVSIAENQVLYRHEGKTYLRGQRTRYRVCYDSWWFDPCRSVTDKPIEGSQAEIVYKEAGIRGKTLYLQGDWQELPEQAVSRGTPLTDVTSCYDKGRHYTGFNGSTPYHLVEQDAHYTAWSLLTTPASVAAAIGIDIPVTIGAFTIGACVLPFDLLIRQQQQQSHTETPPAS